MAEVLDELLSARSLSWLALLVVPLVLVSATSFIKISVVFAALRNALGAPDLPGALVITALSFVLSVFVMAPVAERIEQALLPEAAAQTVRDQPLDAARLWDLGTPVVREFFQNNSDAAERDLFVELAQRQAGTTAGADSLRVLWPAFVLTELKEAFRMALFVVLPFFVIDLVLANVLLALGMTALPPAVVALPLKLLLFISVDGFALLSRALVGGYA